MPTLKVWDGSQFHEIKGDKGDPGEVTTAALEDRVAPVEGRLDTVETETAQTAISVQVLAALRFDPDGAAYGAVRDDPSAAASNLVAIQQAANDARDTGGTLVLKGTYYISGEVQLQCHVDAASATLIVTDENIPCAVLVGSRTPGEVLSRRTISLPAVHQATKSTPGTWSPSVGVEASNLAASHLTVPHVRWFGTGLLMSAYGQGNVYNNVYLGHFDNNKVGVNLQPMDTGGWVNENVFTGGRWSINSTEGTNIPGARHILISPAPSGSTWRPDNNLFVKPSIEGNGPEFHYECYGQDNTILQGRWEASLGAKARFNGAAATRNSIVYGYGLSGVTVSQVNGAVNNWQESWLGVHYYPHATGDTGAFYARSYLRIHGSTNVFASTGSSTDHVIAILTNGSTHDTNAVTDWRLGISAAYLEVKNTTDTHSRFRLTLANGAMEWGPSNAPQDVRLSRRAANTLALDAGDAFGVGTATTAGRPSAAAVGTGAMIYDTTLGRPIWSDGSNWRDATGAVV